MEMLFCVFERKALCCPKDVSALDDLVHDFVYCLQLSLVLKALRLFPWLLRFPRREKPHGYWTLLCLQRAREAKRSWGERPGAITHVFSCFRWCYRSAGFLGKGGGQGQELCLVPYGSLQSRPYLTPAFPSRPSPETGLVQAQGFPFVPHSWHRTTNCQV